MEHFVSSLTHVHVSSEAAAPGAQTVCLTPSLHAFALMVPGQLAGLPSPHNPATNATSQILWVQEGLVNKAGPV